MVSKHSKWAKIKRQKSATDDKRGKLFSRLSRAIISAAATGGGDPQKNVQLRIAIDAAIAQNMPKDSIERAVHRGAGTGAGDDNVETVLLEGYGPGGTALIISAVTRSRNRVVAMVRHALSEGGGSLGEAGSTQWLFEQKGRIVLDHSDDPDAIELAAIDAGVEDIQHSPDGIELLTPLQALLDISKQMEEKGHKIILADLVMIPKNTVDISSEVREQYMSLIEQIEQIEDVIDIVSNANTESE